MHQKLLISMSQMEKSPKSCLVGASMIPQCIADNISDRFKPETFVLSVAKRKSRLRALK